MIDNVCCKVGYMLVHVEWSFRIVWENSCSGLCFLITMRWEGGGGGRGGEGGGGDDNNNIVYRVYIREV